MSKIKDYMETLEECRLEYIALVYTYNRKATNAKISRYNISLINAVRDELSPQKLEKEYYYSIAYLLDSYAMMLGMEITDFYKEFFAFSRARRNWEIVM